MEKSEVSYARSAYKPKLPKGLQGAVQIQEGEKAEPETDKAEIKKLFPNTYGMPLVKFVAGEEPKCEPFNVGVLLSGGQAPGGHNVICGIFDEIKKLNKDSRLFGFLMGPGGLIKQNYKELTLDIIDQYRNTGGFDMIGSDRTKLETKEQFESAIDILHKLECRALVIVGGDDSNTNAAVLAEYCQEHNTGIQIIGVPKTIDGDVKNKYIDVSFGFDTATKVYAQLVGNIERDTKSSQKYWHFIKLMGRSASHIALECALQTHPTVCLISEEVQANEYTLNEIVNYIAGIVADRASRGMNYGVVLVPEGLIEFIPAIGKLISELSDLLAKHAKDYKDLGKNGLKEYIMSHLTKDSADAFELLPDDVAYQLAMVRDPHGNVPVSQVETHIMLAHMVNARLQVLKREDRYNGSFSTQFHFFGYEGRCANPTNYDADYCYSLGICAAQLVANGKNGYMACVDNTADLNVDNWVGGGIPLSMLLNMEKRNGKMKPVIKKTLVDLNGAPFKKFVQNRDKWAKETCYTYPGPIQYWGPPSACDRKTKTLKLEHEAGQDASDLAKK